jgi:UDP-N-acetylglucosamine:LPS N-acetylglucosamine transferase
MVGRGSEEFQDPRATGRASAAARADEERLSVPGLKVALVSSAGGHLIQLYQLRPWWEKHERFWVTFDMPDSRSLLEGEEVFCAYHPTTRNIPNLLRNLRLAWRTLRAARPDVVVSTGAAVAFPFFLVARLLRIKTTYVEVYDRIDLATLSGRLCYPLSNLFLLQWEEQKRFYPRGKVIGALL